MQSERTLFYKLHRELIKKAIEELSFEKILKPQRTGSTFKLDVTKETSYRFEGRLGAWDNLRILGPLKKFTKNKEISDFTMSSFFREIQDRCEMSDETLSRFLEEGNQTIYSEKIKHHMLSSWSFEDLVNADFQQIDQLLLGHPKLIMNKGRLGWGLSDLERFSPENSPQFQMRWIAVNKKLCQTGTSLTFPKENVYREALLIQDFTPLLTEFELLPIHPWQWDQYVAIQFLEHFATGDMIDLGTSGELYSPQASLRTLSSMKNPRYDIKLSLSILNTSSVRGIPGKYIQSGHLISQAVEDIINEDPILTDKIQVLKEVHAVKIDHEHFQALNDCSYRYKEFLGCVWRENVQTKLHPGEKALPTGALIHRDEKNSFISMLIISSGLPTKVWMEKYFKVVVLPLYHLQIAHGLGLVSHGQNTILVHKGGVPSRLIIKDFHGDLRIAINSKHRERAEFHALDRLPSHYLIHDLFTGHFITVLRYLSGILHEEGLLSEKDFYQSLGEAIEVYHLSSNAMPTESHLLRQHFERILVNKVRFVMGYEESKVRLKPLLGESILNPLVSIAGDLS